MAMFPCNIGSSGGTPEVLELCAMVSGGSSNNYSAIIRSDYYNAASLANNGNYFTVTSNGVIKAKVACKVWVIVQDRVYKNEVKSVSAGDPLGNYFGGYLGISQLFMAIT